MVLRRRRSFVLLLLSLLMPVAAVSAVSAAAVATEDKPGPNEVILPLHDYLALVEKGDAVERERAREVAQREAPVAEVVVQRTAIVVGDASDSGGAGHAGKPGGEAAAEISAHFEALVQGHPKEALLLPFHGLAVSVQVAPQGKGSAVSAGPEHGLLLVAPTPGRYTVDVRGRVPLEDRGGVRRLVLAPVAAAVAEVALELPADLAWSSPGAVVVEDRVAGDRRSVRFAVHRGDAPTLEIQRRLVGTEAEKLLAQSVVLTLFQLRPDGFRRHDVVLYEVSRGSLASLSVDLPADLSVEQVATDEGDVVPVVDAHRLTVHRRQQLQGIGYLVLTSTPPAGAATLPASAVTPAPTPGLPEVEVRARYLTVASSVAADVQPTPAASWTRVDLSDLPPALGQALLTLDLTAAWRWLGDTPTASAASAASAAGAGTPGLAIALLPPSARLPTLVRTRETTTLVTVDGTVLHRDRFTLDQAGAALDLTLPAGAVLWSAKVGTQTVRPVERTAGSGVLSVPLGFARGGMSPASPISPASPGSAASKASTVVEVVSVLEHTIPKGRSELALTLPQVAAPVVLHQWRVLLPEGASYRFKRGDLRPARETRQPETPIHFRGGAARGEPVQPVAVPEAAAAPPPPSVDRINVGGNENGREDRPIATGATVTASELANVPSAPTARDFAALSKELKQGMVGGVKPLPVAIPETGKVLLLTGALPPAQIRVEIDVKGKR